MSEATREKAMHHAVVVCQTDGVDAVLEAAKKFNAFLEGGAADKPATAGATKPAAAAAKPAAGKPAARKPAAAEADEEATVTKATRKAAAAAEAEDAAEEGGEETEATAEAVETVIADLLGANLRKQAVALLAEYGAKSASGVKAADRAAFLEQAQGLLLGA